MDRFKQGLNLVGSFAKEKGSQVGGGGSGGRAKEEKNANRTFDLQGKRYRSKRLLGEGGFGYVYLVGDDRGGQYALKHLILSSREQLDQAKHELSMMQMLSSHKNIVKIEESSVSKSEVFIVMEYCPDRVLDMMNDNIHVKFKEDQIWKIFSDVCEGVYFLHNRETPIAHRDLKVENVLLGNDGSYKLCDFGSATTKTYYCEKERDRGIDEDDIQKNTTMEYRSPEMVDLWSKKIINEKVDIWALGVLLYKLTFFENPFTESLGILNNRYFIPEEHRYSNRIIEFIKYLLESDPGRRPDIYDVVARLDKMRGKEINRGAPLNKKKAEQQPSERVASPRAESQSHQSPRNQNSQNLFDEEPPRQQAKPQSNMAGGGQAQLFDMVDWEGQNANAPRTENVAERRLRGHQRNHSLGVPASNNQSSARRSQLTMSGPIDNGNMFNFEDPTKTRLQTHHRSTSDGSTQLSDSFKDMSVDGQSNNSKAAVDKLKNNSLNARNAEILKNLLALPENRTCADCGRRDPTWASTNLGIFICMTCSGIHRHIGTHVSKVKSVSLDTWDPEQVRFMENMGNAAAKRIWEARVPKNYVRPNENDSQSVIKKWIVAKYEDCEFKSLEPPAKTLGHSSSTPNYSGSSLSPTAGRSSPASVQANAQPFFDASNDFFAPSNNVPSFPNSNVVNQFNQPQTFNQPGYNQFQNQQNYNNQQFMPQSPQSQFHNQQQNFSQQQQFQSMPQQQNFQQPQPAQSFDFLAPPPKPTHRRQGSVTHQRQNSLTQQQAPPSPSTSTSSSFGNFFDFDAFSPTSPSSSAASSANFSMSQQQQQQQQQQNYQPHSQFLSTSNTQDFDPFLQDLASSQSSSANSLSYDPFLSSSATSRNNSSGSLQAFQGSPVMPSSPVKQQHNPANGNQGRMFNMLDWQ